jgi:hypothetical protein
MGVFVLVAALAFVGDLFPQIPNWQMFRTAILLFTQLFRAYFANPSLFCAHLLFNVCPAVIHKVDVKHSDLGTAFIDCLETAHSEEQKQFQSNSQTEIPELFPNGDGTSSESTK